MKTFIASGKLQGQKPKEEPKAKQEKELKLLDGKSDKISYKK